MLPAVVLLAAAGGLVVSAYVAASRTDIDGTTEVAAVVVLAAGVLAGSGRTVLASAGDRGAGCLLSKDPLAAMVRADSMTPHSARASGSPHWHPSFSTAARRDVMVPAARSGLESCGTRHSSSPSLSSPHGLVRRARIVGPQRGVIVRDVGGVISSTWSRSRSREREPLSCLPHAWRLPRVGVIGACSVMLLAWR
jgi:hypothetical protein